MIDTSGQITQKLKALKSVLEEKYGISEIGLFGSFMRGEQTASSDIDLLISFKSDQTITLFTLVDLEDFLKLQLKRQIHLAIKDSLKKRMAKYILSEVRYV